MQELDQDQILNELTNQDYKYGFTTDVETYVIEKGLNVREVENLRKTKNSNPKSVKQEIDPNINAFVKKLTEFFGTKVSLHSKEKNYSKGSIIIDYYSLEDLSRIQEMMDR